ncbi:hypothetical protein Droror1_Dr00024192 [Drosera rotundifolia]
MPEARLLDGTVGQGKVALGSGVAGWRGSRVARVELSDWRQGGGSGRSSGGGGSGKEKKRNEGRRRLMLFSLALEL